MDDISHIAQSLPPLFTISLSISSSIHNLPISSIFILLSPGSLIFPLPLTFPPFSLSNLYSITPNASFRLLHLVSSPKSLIESIAMTVDGPSLLPLPPSAKLSLPTYFSSHSFPSSPIPPFFDYPPFPLITHFISLSTSSPCVSSPMTPATTIVCVPKSTTHILWMKCVANAYR